MLCCQCEKNNLTHFFQTQILENHVRQFLALIFEHSSVEKKCRFFQQDGETAHTASSSMAALCNSFWDRIISWCFVACSCTWSDAMWLVCGEVVKTYFSWPGQNLSYVSSCREFLRGVTELLRAKSGTPPCLKLGHDLFLSHSFQFGIRCIIFRCVVLWAADIIVK